jgi:hypothetical protein
MYICCVVLLIALRVCVGMNVQFGLSTFKGNQGISVCIFHYSRICCSCVDYLVRVLYGIGYVGHCLHICLLFIFFFLQ